VLDGARVHLTRPATVGRIFTPSPCRRRRRLEEFVKAPERTFGFGRRTEPEQGVLEMTSLLDDIVERIVTEQDAVLVEATKAEPEPGQAQP
jgi:hypothetical protein